MKTFLSIIASVFITMLLHSQHAGNMVYGNAPNYANNRAAQQSPYMGVRNTDSTQTISARVLYNIDPDYCVVTIGLSEERSTLADCLKTISDRIDGITAKLAKLGIAEEDFYVDFIAQAKIYDYTVDLNAKTGTQHETGLEVKKNLIVKLKDLDYFDQLVIIASEEKAYNIVKVDYFNEDMEGIYDQLFDDCVKIIERKRKRYSLGKDKLGDGEVALDNYYHIAPANQYRNYEAFESSSLQYSNYRTDELFVSKEARKATTFYYNGAAASGFDRVVNMDKVRVGNQFVMELSIMYEKRK